MSATLNPSISAFTLDTVRRKITPAGYMITAVYVGPNNSGVLASFYAAHPFGEEYGSTGATLYEVEEEPSGGTAGSLTISLRYQPPDSSASGSLGSQPVGYTSLESDCSPVEWPIEKKPPNATQQGISDESWATQAADFRTKGTEAWVDPQPNVTRTDVIQSSALSMTEDDIFGQTGKVLSNIGDWGVTGSSGNKWLMTGKRITLNGETKTVVRTAQGNRAGWDTQYIYLQGSEPVEN